MVLHPGAKSHKRGRIPQVGSHAKMNGNLASTESILNRPCKEEGLEKLPVSFFSLSDFFLKTQQKISNMKLAFI